MVVIVDLTFDDVVNIHSEIQRRFNISPAIKDRGLLESIVDRPNFRPYGHIPFRSIYAKCASLVEGIIKWHPFIDRNKRTGLAVAFAYMHQNSYYVMLPLSAVRFSVLIAQNKKNIHQITNWIHSISAKDFETYNKKMDKTLKGYQRVLDLHHAGDHNKANKIIDDWLACDIYPEYRSQGPETIRFIGELVRNYPKYSIRQKII